MKIEEIIGANAGKVWHAMKGKGALSPSTIAKETKLNANDVFGALGWLGREGKVKMINDKKGVLYQLNE